MKKRFLMPFALAAVLTLAGCGTHTPTSTSTETATAESTSESTSQSTSTATSSEPGPEAPYQLTEDEFVQLFLHGFNNCTMTGSYLNEQGTSSEKREFTLLFADAISEIQFIENNPLGGGMRYESYTKIDENGYGIDCYVDHSSTSAYFGSGNGMDLTPYGITSGYEAQRAELWEELFLMPLDESVFDSNDTYKDSVLTPYVQEFYRSLSYDAASHSYKGLLKESYYGYSLDVTSRLSFVNKQLQSLSASRTTPEGEKYSTTLMLSAYGATNVTIATEVANYLRVYKINYYDDDGKTLLYASPTGYQGTSYYEGAYPKAAPDTTGAYRLKGWHLPLNTTILSSNFFNHTTGDHDVVAKWELVKNADLYSFDTATKTLKITSSSHIGEMKFPDTWTVGTTTYDVEILDISNLDNNVTKITIPAHVKSLVSSTELYGYRLQITLDAANTNLKLVDGVLYDKDETILYAAYKNNGMTDFVLPKTVKTISPNAFRENATLKSLDLSGGVLEDIGYEAFSFCHALTSVTFPATLKTLGAHAFDDDTLLAKADLSVCPLLTTVLSDTFNDCHSLAQVLFPAKLTSIGGSAFADCHSLTSVSLPSTVTSLGNRAFRRCGALKTAILPDSDGLLSQGETFQEDYSLTTCVIPSKTTAIGGEAFAECVNYVYSLPTSLKTIGTNAFQNCIGPTFLSLTKDLTSIGEEAFYGNTGLKKVVLNACTSLTKIDRETFMNCTSLETITFPSTITTIARLAFGYDTALKSLAIPGSCTSVDSAAFFGCTNLSLTNDASAFSLDETGHFLYNKEQTTLLAVVGQPTTYVAPKTLTEVSYRAFSGLKSLTTVDFSAVSASFAIDQSAFKDCVNLTNIIWPSEKTVIATIGGGAFENTGFVSLTLPENVDFATNTEGTFQKCAKLQSIDMSASLATEIPNYLFYGCTALKDVKLSPKLTYLGMGEFEGCASLESLVIPKSVVTFVSNVFGDGLTAFTGCTSLKAIYLEATSLSGSYSEYWNSLDGTAKTAVEYLLYSLDEPSFKTTQRYWHYVNEVPTVWVPTN